MNTWIFISPLKKLMKSWNFVHQASMEYESGYLIMGVVKFPMSMSMRFIYVAIQAPQEYSL